MTVDPRVVYGARCVWWGSIHETSIRGSLSGLPCCPVCGGVLFEVASEAEWWAMVDQYDAGNPGYRAFIEWLRGRCFQTLTLARAAYGAERGGGSS